MKVINDNEELKSYIVDGVVKFNESIKCCFDIFIDADIKAHNIRAHNIKAKNIRAHNIDAHNIDACNIDANNIDAHNIKAYDIGSNKIKANNIKADNIKAYSIEAYDILYYAFCIAYSSFKCSNIVGRRVNSIHKCLDNEIEIKKTEINLQGQKFKLSLQEVNNLKQQLK
jgi:hypothetical protein